MRRLILLAAVATFVAALIPFEADARGGGRSGAARFMPPKHSVDMRTRLNRALAQRLRCFGRPARGRCG